MRIQLLLTAILITMSTSGQVQKIANIGVEGWATYTPGGRGGEIIRVTNLNASGPGSFAEAIAATGPRIVVFEVGGIIDFQGSSKGIKNPFITIAGQTAPSPGITIINGALSIQTHDVILQHIRVRPGAANHETGWEPDGISAVSAYNTIIDHCSASWAVDENCSASGPRFEGLTPDDWRSNTSHTLTMSHNIISEGLSNATHTKGEHSKGSLIHDNATEIAILNNLYASNKDRNPLFKGGARGVIVNNYIHNPGSSAIKFGFVESEWLGYEYETGMMSVVGNVMQYGPSSKAMPLCKIGFGPCEVFFQDNVAKDLSGNNVAEFSGDIEKIVDASPVWHPNISLLKSSDVKESIIKNVGARPWDRDETDTRIINEMINGGGKIIDLETEVEGLPVHEPTSAAFIENEWNLNIMMKISSDISLSAPVQGAYFFRDSLFNVEAEFNGLNVGIKSLELMVNGVSQGKLLSQPYIWNIHIDSSGSYELVVIAEEDNMMPLATETRIIHIIDPITSVESFDPFIPCFPDLRAFPNPFHESISFSYVLNEDDFVELYIYNSLGYRMKTVVSGFQTAGRHEVSWSDAGYPTGIYHSLLITGEGKRCRKVILKH
ncbi:MAG: hypothetical protein K9H49_17015 [Bacteroidales bacterium]|nr:hypothetical protein [Bacteroidales bacterium]MCF8390945.1 hypothetical protein [Bacteroidales bacterium]